MRTVLSLDAQRKYQRKPPLLPRRGARPGDPSPWTPKYVGRGRAGLKNRQDTFFDAPPTRSRLTASPKNSPPRRGGACPARGFAAIVILRVLRRHGYYAARRNHPANAAYRANRTGRIYASPTNLPEIPRCYGFRISLLKTCPHRGHTLFIIYYLLSII